MKAFFRLLICIPLLGICSWGFLVHRTINQLAVYELPVPLQDFFYQNMAEVVKASVRADQRRGQDSTEGSKHFIDLELFGDSAAWKMPLHWNEAVAQYGADSLLKYGYVPYQVQAMQQKLTQAFKQGIKDSILFYAIDLAHYIGDAHVPLHTSVNYDGQLTNQKGLHALWETVVPELELAQYQLNSQHRATYLNHPGEAIWNAVRSSFQLLNGVFSEEITASIPFTDSTKFRIQVRNGREVKYYTSTFARAYALRLGNTVNEQLIRSADLIADFWYTCWVDAGKPDLLKLMPRPLSQEELAKREAELRAFRSNQLIPQGLLIARSGNNNQ